MTISMLFIECVKLVSRDLVSSKKVTLNSPRNYEIEIMPSSLQRQQTIMPSQEAVKLVTIVPSSRPSLRSDRLWWGNQGSRRDVEHTRSNLG